MHALTFPPVQERFQEFVPALERWSGTVVALTLIAIGALGIYETYFAKEDEVEAEAEARNLELALAGAGRASRHSLCFKHAQADPPASPLVLSPACTCPHFPHTHATPNPSPRTPCVQAAPALPAPPFP